MLEAGVFEYYLHGFCMAVEIPQTRIMHCKNTNMCLKEKMEIYFENICSGLLLLLLNYLRSKILVHTKSSASLLVQQGPQLMGFYSSIFRYHNNNNIVFVMFLQRATPRFTKKGQVHPYLDATELRLCFTDDRGLPSVFSLAVRWWK